MSFFHFAHDSAICQFMASSARMQIWTSHYIQYFPSIHLMRPKESCSSILEKLMLLTYRYMDYWIPICLFVTLPLWILPGILYYSIWKLLQSWKSILAISKTLICSKQMSSELSYAILRGNGRYLREEGEDVHKKQFYDYTSRRFMSIGDFDPETKIIELECESQVGLKFFAESISAGKVVGVHSARQIPKEVVYINGMIAATNYELIGESVGYDCMILFNFKNKVTLANNQNGVDLIKILAYCRYHMHQTGYIVFGDYFEDGEVNTFIELFEAFKLKIVDQEDITKNIDYARKLEKKNQRFEEKMIEKINKSLHEWVDVKKCKVGKKFIVLIAEKEA